MYGGKRRLHLLQNAAYHPGVGVFLIGQLQVELAQAGVGGVLGRSAVGALSPLFCLKMGAQLPRQTAPAGWAALSAGQYRMPEMRK